MTRHDKSIAPRAGRFGFVQHAVTGMLAPPLSSGHTSRALPAERDACNPLWINYPVAFSHPHQSGPRMKGRESDWLVYNLNLLQVVLGQGFQPRSRAALIFRHTAERRPGTPSSRAVLALGLAPAFLGGLQQVL